MKAQSVTEAGEPDGFVVPTCWAPEIVGGGHTRLVVSAEPDRLAEVHQALVGALPGPLRLLYVRLTDRAKGQLPSPERFVSGEHTTQEVLAALGEVATLVYEDGRHQLWVRGAGRSGAQVVLEETGVIYVYPDDPSFRDALLSAGVPEERRPTMADRDYVKVSFVAEADVEERGLIEGFGLTKWK